MKYYLPLLAVLLLSACAGDPPPPKGEEFELRAATPGVVDHNVIPKK